MIKRDGFSLMEMMVVLLIVSVVAAASAPMVNKKLTSAVTDKSPWVWAGNQGDIAFNMNGVDTVSASIGSFQVPAAAGAARLYLDGSAQAPQLSFGRALDSIANIWVGASTINFSTTNTQAANSTVLGVGVTVPNTAHNSVAIGQDAEVAAANSVVIGKDAAGSRSCVSIGHNSLADRGNSIAVGNSANASWGTTIAIGNSANATRFESIAVGNSANATENGSIAIGCIANATGADSIAIGYSTDATRLGSVAIGPFATSAGVNSTSYGRNANALGDNSVSIGYNSNATFLGVAVGNTATARAPGAIAIGTDSKASVSNSSANNSTAIGAGANAAHINSTAIGRSATTTASNQIVLGTASDTVYIPGTLVVGGTSFLGVRDYARTYVRLQNQDVWGARTGGTGTFRELIQDHSSADDPYVEAMSGPNITTYRNWSDRRLKNVGKVFVAGLKEIKNLEVFNYTFKNDKSKTPRVGVMAQDLQKIFPNAVFKGDDGFLRIRMEDMFYALINAVKELDINYNFQDQRISKLEKENRELKKTIEILEKRLTKLEKKK